MAFVHQLRRPALACLRQSASPASILTSTSRRAFTSLLQTPTRPHLLSSTPSIRSTTLLPSTSTCQPLPSSISPTSLSSLIQTRGHKRKTYNPSHLVRKRRFGFLARLRSKTGKNILKRRRLKGRKMLSH